MARTIINNVSAFPITLPYPLRGVLKPNQAVRVAASVSELETVFGGADAVPRGYIELTQDLDVSHPDDKPLVLNEVGEAKSSNNSFPKTTAGAQTLLPADPLQDRNVAIIIKVTEVFADGDGAQPVFAFGETGDTDKFDDGTLLADAALGATFTLAGTVADGAALLATATAATGTTSTGAIDVTVLALS